MTEKPPKKRLLRTYDEIFNAGWEAGIRDRETRPLTPAEISRLATLLRPYLARTDKTA